MFDIKNDALSKKSLSFDYNDGTLKGSQVTYPGSNFQTNELGLDKTFNVTDNIDVNVKGDLSNLKMDGSTLYTDKSLIPTVTYNKNIGDGLISLSGSKEIMDGGVKPNIGLNFSYPTSDTGKIGLTTNNLLSEDPTGNLSFTKNIGNYGDNTFLDASVEVDPFNTDQYTGMLKFQKKFADGGRVGLNLGGLLTGQAKSIYDSMTAAGYFTEDEIRNAITNAGYEIPGASQPETTAPNIIGAQINQGGGGGGGITELQKTFTPGAQPKGPKFNPNINPAAQLTGAGRLDPMGSDVDYFNTLSGPEKFNFGFQMSDVPGQPGYEAPSKYFEEPSMLNKGITAVKDFFGKFSSPKVRGTLGTRLANQPRLPLPLSVAAYARSPFNPESSTYNPLLEGQLNFLELGDNLIGRDPNTGGLKYGSGSVLAGKNVISGFGTNNYETALRNFIAKMKANKRISTERKTARLAAAEAELKAIQEKQVQDMKDRRADIISRGRKLNPDVYAKAEQLGFIDKDTGGFKSTGTNENFSNTTGRGRTGYSEGGLATMFVEKR